MIKIYDKIANIQLKVSEDIPEEHIEFLKRYWAYDDDLTLVNPPSLLRNEFNVSISTLNDLVQNHSLMRFYMLCYECESMEYQNPTSQSQFKKILLSLKEYRDSHKCEYCQKHGYGVSEKLMKSIFKTELKESKNAIDKKVWRNLSRFENEVLKHAIQFNNMAELAIQYSKENDQSDELLFDTLYVLEKEKLIFLTLDSWGYEITDYEFLPQLKDEHD